MQNENVEMKSDVGSNIKLNKSQQDIEEISNSGHQFN
jgi:hypothetical protein